MSQAHALVGQIALVLGVIAAGWSIVLVGTHRRPGSLFLGSVVWVGLAVGLAAVLGAATAVSVGPPRDALHLVYGALALALVPSAVLIASNRPVDQRAAVAAVASIVLVILLFRLLQTGA